MNPRSTPYIIAITVLAVFGVLTFSVKSLGGHMTVEQEPLAEVPFGGFEIPSPQNDTATASETEEGSFVEIAEAATEAPIPKPKKETPLPKPPAHPEYPTRISIPRIDVDAAVVPVGLTAKGNIAATNFKDVGWYEKSALPEETGSMLMDGHVDNGLFRLGVFKHLDRIRAGNEVRITTGEGKTSTYIVSRIEFYDYKEVPMEAMLSERDRAQLVLITCAGEWLKDEKTYDKRLVVYATLE